MYNLYHIVKAFFPNEEISQNLDEKQESLVSVKLEEDSCFYVPVSEIADCPDCQDGKKKVTKLVYDWLSKVTGRTLAWGMPVSYTHLVVWGKCRDGRWRSVSGRAEDVCKRQAGTASGCNKGIYRRKDRC